MTLQGIADQTLAEKAPEFRAQIQNFADQNIANQSDLRVRYTMAALSALGRMLAGYPGRKNLIWLSESIPFGVYPDVRAMTQAQGSSASGKNVVNKREYADQLALLSNLLADAQVSVYPVDARGLLGGAFYNVANNVSGQGQAGGLANRMEGRQAEELFQAHYNMRDIAEKTGGLPFYNRNDLDIAVQNGIDDGSTYYTLGYYPDNKKWDGQFRKIQITTRRSGARLRYRVGYYAVDRAVFEKQHPQQREVDFSQALNPDYPTATAVQFEVDVLPPAPGEDKVRVNYALDPHQISFEKGADELQRAQVDCAARVFSPKNMDKPVTTEGTRVNAALRPEVYEKIGKSYFPCQLSFQLPEGHYFLRLAVRDVTTGAMGTVNAEVTVPGAAAPKKEPGASQQ
jgi:VWFA-related protein